MDGLLMTLSGRSSLVKMLALSCESCEAGKVMVWDCVCWWHSKAASWCIIRSLDCTSQHGQY